MYNITTVLAGNNREGLIALEERIVLDFNDKTVLIDSYEDMLEQLEGKEPDALVFFLSDKPNNDEKDFLVDIVEKTKLEYPHCIVIVAGGKKGVVKDKGFQEMVNSFVVKAIDKIIEEYEPLRPLVVRIKNKMISVLTGFFAPYLIGEYEMGGFDQLLSGTYIREDNLPILDDLKRRFKLFAPILLENNYQLIARALEIYEERDLSDDEKQEIRDEFFFQFNSLPAMENFSDRRQYYAEKRVLSEVWDNTIAFSKEVGDAVIFGCRKLADVVQLRVTNLVEFDLNKLTPKSKFYKQLQEIEPYGTVKISCQDQVLYIGENHDVFEETMSSGLVFQFYFRVMVPERRKRGLKRF
jgi:hypothetical protein